MFKFFNRLRFVSSDVSGSALLVALLVMGVIVSVSVSLSSLVLREIYSVSELVSYGNAYYAAESATEISLYRLENELPGWDTDGDFVYGKYGDGIAYEYKVGNKCNSFPCFDKNEFDVESMPLDKFYGVLNLNESVTIPMFVVADDAIRSVKNFTVEFFVSFNPISDLKFSDNSDISGWDVLRWRLFGMRNVDGKYITDSLNDFTAVSFGTNMVTGQDVLANAATPSWFGSVSCSDSSLSGDRLSNGIGCPVYNYPLPSGDGVVACDNLNVQDFYVYDSEGFTEKLDCYPISRFLESHSAGNVSGATGLNYITLTNMMNPSILSDEVYKNDADKQLASRIFYRIETFDSDMAASVAEVETSGYKNDVKQSLDTSIAKGSYMPVFNFSLYSTYKKDSETFYYDDNVPKPSI